MAKKQGLIDGRKAHGERFPSICAYAEILDNGSKGDCADLIVGVCFSRLARRRATEQVPQKERDGSLSSPGAMAFLMGSLGLEAL